MPAKAPDDEEEEPPLIDHSDLHVLEICKYIPLIIDGILLAVLGVLEGKTRNTVELNWVLLRIISITGFLAKSSIIECCLLCHEG